MSVAMRVEVEQKIVGRFVSDALAAGHRLAVSLERGYDLDEMLVGSRSKQKIMEAAFAGDECHLFIQSEKGPTVEQGKVVSIGWVYCVFGNSGWDVISDYSMNLEPLMAEAQKISDHYA